MERIYIALMRLASVTLLGGLLFVAMLALNSGQLYPNSSGGDLQGSFFSTLWYAVPGLLVTAFSYLMSGVALFGIAVAWAERRRAWTLALTAAVVVAILFPIALMDMGGFFAIHPRIGALIERNAPFLIYLLLLVPSALALVMARQQNGGRQSERARADATLEITRSSL